MSTISSQTGQKIVEMCCAVFEQSTLDGSGRALRSVQAVCPSNGINADDLKAAARQIESVGACMQVYCTGHSLGGAVASLAAFDIARECKISPQRIKLYTFGCPRLGNRSFANEYSEVRCMHAFSTAMRRAHFLDFLHAEHRVHSQDFHVFYTVVDVACEGDVAAKYHVSFKAQVSAANIHKNCCTVVLKGASRITFTCAGGTRHVAHHQ
jgi:hypothetical protein